MTHIKGALQLMCIDLDRYPSEAQGLAPLLTAAAIFTTRLKACLPRILWMANDMIRFQHFRRLA